jgi:hypothetical protein
MPNKRSRRTRAQNPRSLVLSISGTDQPVTIRGKTLLGINATSGVAYVHLNPLGYTGSVSGITLFPGQRLVYLASAFEEFRFKRLQIVLHPVPSSFTSGYVVGYSKVIGAAVPTTSEGIYEADSSRYISAGQTTPQTLTINSRTLKGGSRVWYQTNYISSNDSIQDVAQGVIYTSNAGTSGGFTLEIAYEIQFRGNDDPSGV